MYSQEKSEKIYKDVLSIVNEVFSIPENKFGYAYFITDSIVDDVIDDVECCADDEYNMDDVRIAIKRVLAKRLQIDE